MYEPEYRLKWGMTTAMKLAYDEILPPKEFYHRPEI